MRLESLGNELGSFSTGLPPLTDSSVPKSLNDSVYVPCFSNQIDLQRNQQGLVFDSFNNNNSIYGSLYSSSTQQSLQASTNLPFPASVCGIQDQAILRALYENNGSNERQMNLTLTTDNNQTRPPPSAASVDLDGLWNY